MKRLICCVAIAGFINVGTVALGIDIFNGESMLISSGEEVLTPDVFINGGTITVTGLGSLLETETYGIDLTGRMSSLQIQNGGVVRSAASLGLYGGSTDGSGDSLVNSIGVTGNGSLLDIKGNVSLWSPDLPLHADTGNLSQVPTYLTVSDGGELIIGGEISVANDSRLTLGQGGRLSVRTNFNASMNGFFWNDGSTLSVEGQFTGLSSLNSGCRLETPSVSGDLMVLGTYAPGNSPANSVLDGILTLDADGTLEMELAGHVLGDEYDHLTVTDTAHLDGTLDIVLLDDFTLSYGDSFDLFNWDGGVSNEFASITTSALTGDLVWDTSDLYHSGTISVIPEPSVASLLFVFGGGVWIIRRYFPKV